MKTLHLRRLFTGAKGTSGSLEDREEGCHLMATLELPWVGNQRRVSCIPAGEYIVDPTDKSTKFKSNWAWVKDVPGRTRIGIHAGNTCKDTRGCILVGEDGALGAVWESRKALKRLLEYVGEEPFKLVIEDCPR